MLFMKKVLPIIALVVIGYLLYPYFSSRFTTPQLEGDFNYAGWYSGADGYDKALRIHRKEGKPMVLYFYTDWCPPCKDFKRDVLGSEVVQVFLSDAVKVYINPELGNHERGVATNYNVRYFPTVYVIPAGTDKAREVVRVWSPEVFMEDCKKAGLGA